ncbi:hypothetical protein BST17_16910 [Mycolicibacterium bacteremicum]|uniref:VWFD domain-containing protein n=1 Tax=Mycolicibacterium bacteremicum TaxID=564198 RepID=A0A1W9YUT9_MYCBA|nr:hypothetical protein BST17_16910 [Mycolicibacterium bacteremicum]
MKAVRTALVLALACAGVTAGPAVAKLAVPPELSGEFAQCATKIAATGNRVISDIQSAKYDNKILLGSSGAYAPAMADVILGLGTEAVLLWNPAETGLLEPNVPAERCASLVHEANHVREYNRGTTDTSDCIYSDASGVQINTGLPVTEVYATYAENRYRKAVGLTERKSYLGKKIPPGEAACEKKKEEPKGGIFSCSVGPVGANCAGSNGDPHLLTFDGVHYDLMAAGEFDVVDGPVRVQARQTAFPGSRDVTLNTAVAADVAGDRVGVYQEDGAVVVRIGSQPVELAVGGVGLPGGGTVGSGDDGAVRIGWPDESTLEVRPIGVWGLSFTLRLAEQHRGKVAGLLGNYNGDDRDDLVIRDGKPLAGNDFGDLYPRYADSWRITDQESLFHYRPGQSTATFTDRSLPDNPVDAASLPHRETAELICRRAGVTDPVLLQGCVLDVALTGQSVFATDAARAQRHTATGDTTLDGAVDRTAVTATAGQRLFVDAVRSALPDQCAVLQLLDADGTRLATGCLSGGTGYIDGTVLPTSAVYTVAVDPAGPDTGQTVLQMHLSTDEIQRITADGATVTATIGTPGAVSSSSFDGRAGEKVFVDVPTSSVPDQCGALQLLGPNDARLDTGCLIGGRGYIDGLVLPTDGRYRIIVDPAGRDLGTAEVRLLAVADQALQTRVGAGAVTATIDGPGAVSRITFDGSVGQWISIDASGSTLPGQCGLLELRDPAGGVVERGCVLGGSGGIDTLALPGDGRYTLVVDPAEAAVGELRVVIRG